MAEPIRINSASNKKLKHVKDLRKKGRTRREEGSFIAEGWHLFEEAPAGRLQAVYVSETAYDQRREAFDALTCPLYLVSEALFAGISDTQSPQGVLSVIAIGQPDEAALLQKERPLFLVLDQINDPGNLGTMIRTAEAAGVSAVLLLPGSADPYQPKVVRSAMGALFRVPVVVMRDDVQTQQWMDRLTQAGVRIYCTDLAGKQAYDAPDYRAGSAFVIGNESHGVSEEIAARCDERIIIPMAGQVESLNAAVATSVLLFEAARQRRI